MAEPNAQRQSHGPLVPAVPESVGMSSERLQRIVTALRSEVQSGQMPGAVVAVARHGRLVFHESVGFLDSDLTVPMPLDALFAIASMTEARRGSGARRSHAARGRPTPSVLGDPVERYLPQLGDRRVASADRAGPVRTGSDRDRAPRGGRSRSRI